MLCKGGGIASRRVSFAGHGNLPFHFLPEAGAGGGERSSLAPFAPAALPTSFGGPVSGLSSGLQDDLQSTPLAFLS